MAKLLMVNIIIDHSYPLLLINHDYLLLLNNDFYWLIIINNYYWWLVAITNLMVNNDPNGLVTIGY